MRGGSTTSLLCSGVVAVSILFRFPPCGKARSVPIDRDIKNFRLLGRCGFCCVLDGCATAVARGGCPWGGFLLPDVVPNPPELRPADTSPRERGGSGFLKVVSCGAPSPSGFGFIKKICGRVTPALREGAAGLRWLPGMKSKA